MENPAQNWLDVQCKAIEGLCSAILLTIDSTKKSFQTAARRPIDSKESTELVPIARIALEQRREAINTHVKDTESSDRFFDYLALPILLNNKLIAVVAIKMAHRSEEKQNEVSDLIKAGLKSFARPKIAKKPPGLLRRGRQAYRGMS